MAALGTVVYLGLIVLVCSLFGLSEERTPSGGAHENNKGGKEWLKSKAL